MRCGRARVVVSMQLGQWRRFLQRPWSWDTRRMSLVLRRHTSSCRSSRFLLRFHLIQIAHYLASWTTGESEPRFTWIKCRRLRASPLGDGQEGYVAGGPGLILPVGQSQDIGQLSRNLVFMPAIHDIRGDALGVCVFLDDAEDEHVYERHTTIPSYHPRSANRPPGRQQCQGNQR